MPKLNQILAVEKGTKNRAETEFTKIHQALMKPDLLSSLSKTYQPKEEDGEKFPPETKKVQLRAEDQIKRVKDTLIELFDVTATKDATNCLAKADVVVDGKVLLTGVPATQLLFIEKKLVDLLTFVRKLPALATRVEKLQKAVKYAREAANTHEVVDLRTGAAVLGYIFDQ